MRKGTRDETGACRGELPLESGECFTPDDELAAPQSPGMLIDRELWVWGVRAAGIFHFVTLVLACFTPIPPGWDENLARLPIVHRRFAVAQNAFIGATIAFCGLLSLGFAPELVAGSSLARAVSGGIALWWLGRLVVLPWLGVMPQLTSRWLRFGFGLLIAECGIYAIAFGWLAVRAAG